jgi:hypothetical protein
MTAPGDLILVGWQGEKQGVVSVPRPGIFMVIMGNMAPEYRREFVIFIGAV